MDEMRLLSIISMNKLTSAFAVADAGVPYPKKLDRTQSKNRGEKKRGHRLPGAALREEFLGESVIYLASPSSAGLSERSAGLSPSQMRSKAL